MSQSLRMAILGILALMMTCNLAACQMGQTGSDGLVSSEMSDGLVEARVERVVDGDTMIVSIDGREETLRLIGINTPETWKSPQGAQPWGDEASAFSRERLSGRTVQLEYDVEQRDQYQRLLAYMWLDGQLFNEILVREGWAEARSYPPNIAHQEQLDQAERSARAENRGLWQTPQH